MQHGEPAVEHQAARRDRQDEVPDHLDGPRPPPRKQLFPRQEMALNHEPRGLRPLSSEGADDPHPAEGLRRRGVDLLPLRPHRSVERAQSAVPDPVGPGQDRQQGHRPEQEPPIDPGQNDHPADELDDRPPGVEEHAEDEVADAVGILAQQARRAAGLELVDPVQRQPRGVLEDAPTGLHLHTLRGPGRQPASPEPDHRADHRHDEHDRHQQEQPVFRPGGDRQPSRQPARHGMAEQHVVNHQLGRGRRQQPQHGGDRQRAQRRGQSDAAARRQPEQLAVEPPERSWFRWRGIGADRRRLRPGYLRRTPSRAELGELSPTSRSMVQ